MLTWVYIVWFWMCTNRNAHGYVFNKGSFAAASITEPLLHWLSQNWSEAETKRKTKVDNDDIQEPRLMTWSKIIWSRWYLLLVLVLSCPSSFLRILRFFNKLLEQKLKKKKLTMLQIGFLHFSFQVFQESSGLYFQKYFQIQFCCQHSHTFSSE